MRKKTGKGSPKGMPKLSKSEKNRKKKQGLKKDAFFPPRRFGKHPMVVFGQARRNAQCSGEDKRRGYKPLLPVLAKIYAKFGQSSENKQESGKGQGKSWQGARKGRKERRMAMERSWAGVGQELGRAGPVSGTPSWASPVRRTAPRIPPGLSMGTAVWDGSLHFESF